MIVFFVILGSAAFPRPAPSLGTSDGCFTPVRPSMFRPLKNLFFYVVPLLEMPFDYAIFTGDHGISVAQSPITHAR